jgi:phosphatidylglycerol---prolipoprotein diacylglyceryl transferase
MLIHPQFDPVALHLGPLAVRWYGLMYLIGFALVWWLGRRRIAARPDSVWSEKDLGDALFYGILGTIIGGRLGYALFYKAGDYLAEPWRIFYVWEGGMSFHGGMIGVICAMWLFARSRKQDWLAITDFIAPLVPIGLGAGRLGNFINAELWGRPTDVPWGMVFPNVDTVPRHPSQLYELALEGVALFVILWLFSMKPRPRGAVSGLFLICYGCFRFLVEFTRQPDSFLGVLALGLTMGQWLSVPMIIMGAALFVWSYRAERRAA